VYNWTYGVMQKVKQSYMKDTRFICYKSSKFILRDTITKRVVRLTCEIELSNLEISARVHQAAALVDQLKKRYDDIRF